MLPSCAIRIMVNASFVVTNYTWMSSQVVFTTEKLGDNFDSQVPELGVP